MATPRRQKKRGAPLLTDVEKASLRALGDSVVATRTRVGITQEELAIRAGVSARYIQKLESGEFNPSYVKLLAVARALGARGRTLLAVPKT
jgi:transcriptional regulator with XRE-family HTH domain